MAVAFRASSATRATSTGALSVTITIPAAVQVDDIMLVWFVVVGGSNVSVTTPPTGWTKAGDSTESTRTYLGAYYKRAVAGDTGGSTTVTFTIDGATNRAMIAMFGAFSGAVTSGTPVTGWATQNNGFGTAQASPQVTTTADNSAVVSCVGFNKNATYTSSEVTERDDQLVTTVVSGAWGEHIVTPAGAYPSSGVIDWTSSASQQGIGQTVIVVAATSTAHALAGTEAGSSTDTGAVGVKYAIAGSEGGTSTDTGNLTVNYALAGSEGGTSTDTGDLMRVVNVAGSEDGTSTDTGDVKVDRGLAGSEGGVGGDQGTLSVAKALAGQEGGVGGDQGAVTVDRGLAGTDAGTSTDTGALTVQVGIIQLAGSDAGTSSDTGSLSVDVAQARYNVRSRIGGRGTMSMLGGGSGARSRIGGRRT